MQAIKFNYLVTILSMLLVISACSGTTKHEIESDMILKVSSSRDCERGSIRPPGLPTCLVIDDILAGKIKFAAPKGKCPVNWQKQFSKAFCLPEFHLIACEQNRFACGTERSDTFRVVKGPSNCKDGTITVSGVAPRFNETGELYLGTTTVLACGPVGKTEPD
ncbi:MAG: hypothetical protein ACJAVV_000278 [Alphaproteobacteria bacterium]|jgi:hypothetical protein